MKTKLLTLFLILFFLLSTHNQIAAKSNILVDPDLESGYPARAYQTSGSFSSGQGLHTLIANIDQDPYLEILATTTAGGLLYAWNADSSLVPGWPPDNANGVSYPAAGNLVSSSISLEIATSHYRERVAAHDASGNYLTGWPIDFPGADTPPTLADINGDGLEEIFVNGSAFGPDGMLLPGWSIPVSGDEMHTPSVADLDNDGDLEIIYAGNSPDLIFAFHHTGEAVTGFPVDYVGYAHTFPAIGDVDDDGQPEIIVVSEGSLVGIYSADGILERSLQAVGQIFYGSAPALADLDGDNTPEIIVQTNSSLNIWKGNGATYPGWPQDFGGNYWLGNSSPVVGDVDGDQLPDIIVTLQQNGSNVDGEVRAYHRSGSQLANFPKILDLGPGAVPAVADIDIDGRNEIIIISNFWGGYSGFFDKIWVYDLGGETHGRIEWGQFGGGPEHRGLYPVPSPPNQPLHPIENGIFLPLISVTKDPTTGTKEKGIFGYVTQNNLGISNLAINLQVYDGVNWFTQDTVLTLSDGKFNFRDLPSLPENQSYFVSYQNLSQNSAYVSSWSSREIENYTKDDGVGISNFDLSNLSLSSPDNNTSTSLPVTFSWSPRNVKPSDRYSLLLYDPVDGSPAYQTAAYLDADGFILYSLPPGFAYDVVYAWTVLIVSPDQAFGFPNEARLISFASAYNTLADDHKNEDVFIQFDWDNYSNLPCSLFRFAEGCTSYP